MNRKSIYCYPTIAAALVATAAMGWTTPGQAQTLQPAESTAEGAISSPEEDASQSVSTAEPLLQEAAIQEVAVQEVAIHHETVSKAVPAEAMEAIAAIPPLVIPEQPVIPEPPVFSDQAIEETATPLPIATPPAISVAEEPVEVAELAPASAPPASAPIEVWSSEVEVDPALAILAAEGAELHVPSSPSSEVAEGNAVKANTFKVNLQATETASEPSVSAQIVAPLAEPAEVTSPEITQQTATQQQQPDSGIAAFQPTATIPTAVASLVQAGLSQPVAVSPEASLAENDTVAAASQPSNLAQASHVAQANTDPETIPEPEATDPETTEPEAIPPTPTSPPPNDGNTVNNSEPRVLVAEVQVSGAEGNPQESELIDAVYDAIQTRPGQPTTSTQLQEDLNAVFATGYFEDVNFRPEDTPLGVRVVFLVNPNPILRQVTASETQVLPAEVIDEAFADQYGQTLNFNGLQDGVKRVNEWYQDNGYVLAQVVDATQVTDDGTVNLVIAEGIVDSVAVRFLDAEGNLPENPDEPIRGRTKDYVVTREFSLKPGDVFRRDQAEADLQRVFGLGIFEDVRLSLDPAPDDPRKVVVVANVIEARSGSIGASGGVSSASGLFGSFSVGQENFRGRNQKLRSEITLGQRDFLFDLSYTDPWIKGDPYRTSYTVNAFRRRSVSLIYSGGDRDVDLPNGDTPRILRLGGGLRFSRPLSKNVFEPAEWNASAGLQYQRISIRDSDGDRESEDEFGNDLTFSGDDNDDLVLVQLGAARDRRNNRLQPTQGSITRLNMDQSVPIGNGSILFNRLRVNHSQYFPVNFLRLTEGCRKTERTSADCPQTLAFNIQAGTILGDLPPYEAFSIGGSNSVRGYGEGEVGSGRSFLQATAEYRFPMFSFVGGALFADFGTDLGSGENVPGDPAGIREKPGSGYGIGLGVRVQSPLGPIRADYTVISDDGDSRFQFGIGQRF